MNAYVEWLESIRQSLGVNKSEFARRIGVPSGTLGGTYKGNKPGHLIRARIRGFTSEEAERKAFCAVWEENNVKGCIVFESFCKKRICCFTCKDFDECDVRCKNTPTKCGCVDERG